jgi:isocitrate dehydrogenase
MNSQQLQIAIDKCTIIIVEKGTSLKHYQPHFYERLCEVTLKMLNTQAVRAGMITQSNIQFKEKKND